MGLLFVEGPRDFYFFSHVFRSLKAYRNTEILNGNFPPMIYYGFRKLNRHILNSENDIFILLSNCGKTSAIGAFIETLNSLLRTDNPIENIALIIDRDRNSHTVADVFDMIRSLNKRFTNYPPQFTNEGKFKQLNYAIVTRKSKKINVGIIEIVPDLEQFLATFLRNYANLPKTLFSGSVDEILSNISGHLGASNIEEFCQKIVNDYGAELLKELNRTSLKSSLCRLVTAKPDGRN